MKKFKEFLKGKKKKKKTSKKKPLRYLFPYYGFGGMYGHDHESGGEGGGDGGGGGE